MSAPPQWAVLRGRCLTKFWSLESAAVYHGAVLGSQLMAMAEGGKYRYAGQYRKLLKQHRRRMRRLEAMQRIALQEMDGWA